MHIWGGVREVLRVYGVLEGNRSKPREGMNHIRDGVTQDHEGSPKSHWKDSSAQQVCLESKEKCFPFFKTLKWAFVLRDECEKAFQELKQYLSNPRLLSPSKEGENLYLYLVMSTIVVSVALIREEDKRQLLVYYVSQTF